MHNTVKAKLKEWSLRPEYVAFTDLQKYNVFVFAAIYALCNDVSPGIDGVTTNHLIYGNYESLRTQLSQDVWTDICVPVYSDRYYNPHIEKATLDPNIPNNYRPIILVLPLETSEFLLLPCDTACPN